MFEVGASVTMPMVPVDLSSRVFGFDGNTLRALRCSAHIFILQLVPVVCTTRYIVYLCTLVSAGDR
jgi:hypothetical protein